MQQDYSAISIATLVAAVFSLIGSSTILLSYLWYSRGIGISKMIMFLAIADYGWSIVEIGAFSIIIDDNANYTATICKVARGLFQLFSGAAVMWSMCIGIFLYRNVAQSAELNTDHQLESKKSHKPMIIYHLISWGVPSIQCAIIFFPPIQKKYMEIIPDQHICMPKEPYLLVWFLPIIIAIIISAVVYSMLLNVISKKTKASGGGVDMYQQLPFRLGSYVLVLLLCWVPNLVAYVAQVYSRDTMLVVNGLLELQGTLDCLVYGFTNREFRKNFKGIKGPFKVLLSPIILPFATVWAIFLWACKTVQNANAPEYHPILDTKGSSTVQK